MKKSLSPAKNLFKNPFKSPAIIVAMSLVASFVAFVSLPAPASSLTYLSLGGESITQSEVINLDMEKAVGGLYTTTDKALWNFVLPLADGRITSSFGLRRGEQHKGLDFGKHWGALIYAVQDGVVMRAGNLLGFGNVVEIAHGSGIVTRYAHLSSFPVSVGDDVSQGQVIGAMGNTGVSNGPHLHFEVLIDGFNKDPQHYLPSR